MDGRNAARVHREVKQEDEERKSIVQQIMHKSTDFQRRIIMPIERQGRVTLSRVCSHCHRYLLEDNIWCSSGHGDVKKK